jgi:alanyl-tRNA synthetase
MLTDALEGADRLPGHVMFQLWDTYGFPVEMTQEIARESNVTVDLEGFEREMAAQRERGRANVGQFGGDRSKIRVYESLGVGVTRFVGYEKLTHSSVVVGLIANNQSVSSASEGESVEVVIRETPFYAEGGGQVGDAGEIVGPDGRMEVEDTQSVMPGLAVQFGKLAQGTLRVGDTVECYVDPVRREDSARNHTATHLLHAALRQVLGPHVRQAGSYVGPERLRFDFTHVQPLTDEELWQVQFLVNEKIRYNARVLKSEDTYTSAIRRGALAFFGDKYGDTVRLIEIANGAIFSFEVCGGTHVQQTGEVGSVYILGESSIGAGMRRMEAISGRSAEKLVWERFHQEERVARTLQTSVNGLESRIDTLLNEVEVLRREKEVTERRLALQSAEGLLDSKREVAGVTLVTAKTVANNVDSLREIGDWLRDKLKSGVVVLGMVNEGRPTVAITITSDLVERGLDARNFARELGRIIGGGGGGRPEMAQAGGKLADKLEDALEAAGDIIAANVKS